MAPNIEGKPSGEEGDKVDEGPGPPPLAKTHLDSGNSMDSTTSAARKGVSVPLNPSTLFCSVTRGIKPSSGLDCNRHLLQA